MNVRSWLLALVLVPALALAQTSPEELVDRAARNVLAALNADRERYREDPSALEAVIRRELISHFDVDYAARLILGRHGRGVPAEKIERFAQAMIRLLVARYADGLLEFRSTDQYQVLPLSGSNTERLTRVRTLIRLDDGTTAPVDYAFHKTDDGWKVFDVTVEGISYITTYRNQFAQEIAADGLDRVIERLEAGEEPIDV
jgi:phospholipid transport system substrate-binding protein